jgi:hypothetical protein
MLLFFLQIELSLSLSLFPTLSFLLCYLSTPDISLIYIYIKLCLSKLIALRVAYNSHFSRSSLSRELIAHKFSRYISINNPHVNATNICYKFHFNFRRFKYIIKSKLTQFQILCTVVSLFLFAFIQ